MKLEPDYSEGYTCDTCHKDFLRGPFYHDAKSGYDLCIPCGENIHYHPLRGLVGSLLFPNSDELYVNRSNGSFVLFAYRTTDGAIGYHFSNSDTVVVNNTSEETESLFFSNEATTKTVKGLPESSVAENLAWLPSNKLLNELEEETSLSFVDASRGTQSKSIDEVVFIESFAAHDAFIELHFSDGRIQILDAPNGRQFVLKNNVLIAYFVMNAPGSESLSEAEAMLQALRGTSLKH